MRRILISGGLLLPLSLFADACISDLPAPITCPPKEQRAATDCSAIGVASFVGCPDQPPFAQPYAQCLTGPRQSCACTGNECPADRSACYPASDCPAAVVAIAGKEARCIRLAPEDLALGGPNCVCGCASCASVCDGVGPVIVARVPQNAGEQAVGVLLVQTLSHYLPDQGRLGVYIRARGITSQAVEVGGGKIAMPFARPLQMASANAGTFGEQVLFEKGWPDWTTRAEAPTTLAIVTQPGPTLTEIDCVIPFFVPNP